MASAVGRVGGPAGGDEAGRARSRRGNGTARPDTINAAAAYSEVELHGLAVELAGELAGDLTRAVPAPTAAIAGQALGICIGAEGAFVAPRGLVRRRLSACALAWRI